MTDDQIKRILENNKRYTLEKISNVRLNHGLKMFCTTYGYDSHFDVYLPHKQKKTT